MFSAGDFLAIPLRAQCPKLRPGNCVCLNGEATAQARREASAGEQDLKYHLSQRTKPSLNTVQTIANSAAEGPSCQTPLAKQSLQQWNLSLGLRVFRFLRGIGFCFVGLGTLEVVQFEIQFRVPRGE